MTLLTGKGDKWMDKLVAHGPAEGSELTGGPAPNTNQVRWVDLGFVVSHVGCMSAHRLVRPGRSAVGDPRRPREQI